MTIEQKKTKVLAAIEVRGWSLAEVFWEAAKELEKEGKVKLSTKHFTGGNRKGVWVAA